MGFSRPRYNQKARSHRSNQQTPNELNQNQDGTPTDSINPPSTEKMSKKKQKRFESYLAKKLKKDQHHQLLKEIEESQSTVLDPSALVSTANLNSASVARTQREIKEVEAKIELRKRERAQLIISNRKRKHQTFHSDDENQEEDDEKYQVKKNHNWKPTQNSTDLIIPNSFSGALTIEPNEFTKNSGPPKPSTSDHSQSTALLTKPTLGSALAPNAVTRVVSKRKPKTVGWKNSKRRADVDQIESDEDSFNSSDSAYDSSSDEEKTSSKSSHQPDLPEEEEEWTGCQFEVENEDVESLDEEMERSGSKEQQERVKGSFRDWANAQLLQVDNNQSEEPTLNQDVDPSSTPIAIPTNPRPQRSDTKCGPLGAPLDLPETDLFLHQKTINVPLTRSEDIKASRSLLPIFAEEHTVMDAIRRHPVVVICGETGSGKTTQLPQFLYEAGWGREDGDNPGMIGITQPRRVAAVSMASRVENEMGLKGKGVVAFQIRYEATTEHQTRLKFMTDGVLLRELAADFLLSKYSVIIVDEAHERSVNTDVLIGVLSRIVRLRLKMWREQFNKPNETGKSNQVKPLRLIIMSATLRVTDFTLNTTLFSEPPPVITIAARQFPVAVHFNRKTNGDYITESYKKASKIHTRLPPGGILIFLTGQLEIMNLCKKLSNKYGKKSIEERKKGQSKSFIKLDSRRSYTTLKDVEAPIVGESELNTDTVEVEDIQLGKDTHDLAADVDEGHEAEEDPEALDTEDEDDMEENDLDLMEDSDVPMYILPLYSLLPTDEQMKVFEDPPEDSRLVVIATNVAETSLTIPNIRYVIDSGRAKERHYDLSSGIQSFEIDWISKASASQRSGRAGRTGPGHCYRLYSSAVYENYFQDYSKPEIQRMPIDGIVLQMKSMNIDTVTNFPFPTPPDRYSLRKAEVGLAHLGALTFQKGFDHWCLDGEKVMEARITELGRIMAQYPLTPRFARMLVSGSQHGCLPYVIALVSILSVGDPFLHEDVITGDDGGSDEEQLGAEIHEMTSEELKLKEIRKSKRKRFYQIQQQYSKLGGGMSDLFKSLSVVGAYEFNKTGSSEFCEENFLRLKAMEEIHKLRKQITKIVQKNHVGEGLVEYLSDLRPPNELQLKVLRQLITASFIDQVAIKASLLPNSSSTSNKTNQNKNHLIAYRTIGIKEEVFIHPSSILFTSSSINSPEFIVFQELIKTKNRIWIKGITKVNQAWLPVIGKSLCTFKSLEGIKPLKKVEDQSFHEVSKDENQRVCFVQPRFGGPGLDFELNPIEVIQKKVGNRWVFV
ncbi:P-loop containing nucleoside triphosphate hydrolase protein [Melampsora americana]|nr:P-loop containing nucleoside triphosphate hydrolase protein [Melampsora americana]